MDFPALEGGQGMVYTIAHCKLQHHLQDGKAHFTLQTVPGPDGVVSMLHKSVSVDMRLQGLADVIFYGHTYQGQVAAVNLV